MTLFRLQARHLAEELQECPPPVAIIYPTFSRCGSVSTLCTDPPAESSRLLRVRPPQHGLCPDLSSDLDPGY